MSTSRTVYRKLLKNAEKLETSYADISTSNQPIRQPATPENFDAIFDEIARQSRAPQTDFTDPLGQVTRSSKIKTIERSPKEIQKMTDHPFFHSFANYQKLKKTRGEEKEIDALLATKPKLVR